MPIEWGQFVPLKFDQRFASGGVVSIRNIPGNLSIVDGSPNAMPYGGKPGRDSVLAFLHDAGVKARWDQFHRDAEIASPSALFTRPPLIEEGRLSLTGAEALRRFSGLPHESPAVPDDLAFDLLLQRRVAHAETARISSGALLPTFMLVLPDDANVVIENVEGNVTVNGIKGTVIFKGSGQLARISGAAVVNASMQSGGTVIVTGATKMLTARLDESSMLHATTDSKQPGLALVDVTATGESIVSLDVPTWSLAVNIVGGSLMEFDGAVHQLLGVLSSRSGLDVSALLGPNVTAASIDCDSSSEFRLSDLGRFADRAVSTGARRARPPLPPPAPAPATPMPAALPSPVPDLPTNLTVNGLRERAVTDYVNVKLLDVLATQAGTIRQDTGRKIIAELMRRHQATLIRLLVELGTDADVALGSTDADTRMQSLKRSRTIRETIDPWLQDCASARLLEQTDRPDSSPLFASISPDRDEVLDEQRYNALLAFGAERALEALVVDDHTRGILLAHADGNADEARLMGAALVSALQRYVRVGARGLNLAVKSIASLDSLEGQTGRTPRLITRRDDGLSGGGLP